MSDKYVVKGKNNHFNMMTKALLEFQEKVQEGYVLDQSAVGVANRAVFSRSMIRLPMVKPVAVITEPEVGDTPVVAEVESSQEELIEAAILASEKIKKDDLLWFAEQRDIEVPEDMKLPLQIRKFLKEKIEG